VLAALTCAVYAQVGGHEFLVYDDREYVTDNPRVKSGLSAGNIAWAFTAVEAANWHPLAWLSHMADVELFGMNPGGHHLTSVAIHAASAALLLVLLFWMTGALWKSAFVAALFALHPVHVESVAWVAERKDVLCAFFWMLTLLAYGRYAARRSPVWYLVCFLCFVLGLMAKPMAVTLPAVMLLMDVWPLGRYRRAGQGAGAPPVAAAARACIVEKLPFFAASLLAAVMTIHAQSTVQALASLTALPVGVRVQNALVAYVAYMLKTLWPQNLSVIYFHPGSVPAWQAAGAAAVLTGMSAAVLRLRRAAPYLAVGWLWYLVTLVPVIGFVQVGVQAMADRYTYLPVIGLFIMAAWGIPDLMKAVPGRAVILAVLAGAAVLASAALTWRQAGYWRDGVTLFQHAVRVTANNYVAYYELGNAYAAKAAGDPAAREKSHIYLGYALAARGDHDKAIEHYRAALRSNPNNAQVRTNLGRVLENKGDLDGAIREYREALRLNGRDLLARRNLDEALAKKNRGAGP
jgi:tetratricopeptide (TPR) repeat protein